MYGSLPKVSKTSVQLLLLFLFWLYFGHPSVLRYQAGRVMVTSLTGPPDPHGVPAPAVTVCARNRTSRIGWKKMNRNITKWKDILQHQCGLVDNITACIFENTYSFDEVIGEAAIGDEFEKSLMNQSFWIADFTYSHDGRCYTLSLDEKIGDKRSSTMMFFSKAADRDQIVYIHDPNFFVINDNPKALSKIKRKVRSNQYSESRIALVDHRLLNRPSAPCVEDPDYSFRTCVRTSFSSQVGCRLVWDMWSDQDRQVCHTMQQYRKFEYLYAKIYKKGGQTIEDKNHTGCVKPCHYREYRMVDVPQVSMNMASKYFVSYFGLLFVSTETILEEEILVYPWTSLVAEFGGTLGLFLGFSFMMLWDGAALVASLARKTVAKTNFISEDKI